MLASWEKEPLIHLFSVAQRQHVALPKPNFPFTVEGKTYNALHVDELAFAPNGRDAIVFTMGQVGASSRWITTAHYVALDGKSAPRPIFRVDEGVKLHSSWHGAVFAVPQDPKQECSHQRCWPIRAIVAYEIAGDRVTQRTLLDGAHVDLSSARPIYGSDDDHVGMVLDLVRRDGVRRLNGGRALLRWHWGDAQADYRPLPGNNALTPVWRITKTGDFVEAVHRYEGESQRLEIQRYPRGTGEPVVTSLRSLEPGASPMGLGERADGGLWLQWGERIALLSPGKPSRSFNVEPLMQRGWEWAGAQVYVASPESLWVGLDGRGRQFVRLDLADVERRSKPWPEANAAPAPRTSPRR